MQETDKVKAPGKIERFRAVLVYHLIRSPFWGVGVIFLSVLCFLGFIWLSIVTGYDYLSWAKIPLLFVSVTLMLVSLYAVYSAPFVCERIGDSTPIMTLSSKMVENSIDPLLGPGARISFVFNGASIPFNDKNVFSPLTTEATIEQIKKIPGYDGKVYAYDEPFLTMLLRKGVNVDIYVQSLKVAFPKDGEKVNEDGSYVPRVLDSEIVGKFAAEIQRIYDEVPRPGRFRLLRFNIDEMPKSTNVKDWRDVLKTRFVFCNRPDFAFSFFSEGCEWEIVKVDAKNGGSNEKKEVHRLIGSETSFACLAKDTKLWNVASNVLGDISRVAKLVELTDDGFGITKEERAA